MGAAIAASDVPGSALDGVASAWAASTAGAADAAGPEIGWTDALPEGVRALSADEGSATFGAGTLGSSGSSAPHHAQKPAFVRLLRPHLKHFMVYQLLCTVPAALG
jgi:hypothetical protein